MKETILNIYLIIDSGRVTAFRAVSYNYSGDDDEKIKFLKSKVENDYGSAEVFNAPQNKFNHYMKYSKFSLLETKGLQYELFETIFSKYEVPENPLICVTPVVDGKITLTKK